MVFIKRFWQRATQPYHSINDRDIHRDTVTLASVSLGVLIVSIGGVSLTIPYYTLEQIIMLLPVLTGILLFLVPYHMSRQGRITSAAHLLAMIAWVLMTSAIFSLPSEIGLEVTYYYVMIPIFSSFYHRYTETFIYFIIAITSPLILYILGDQVTLIQILRGPIGFILYMSSFVGIFAYLAYTRELDKREQLRLNEQRRSAFMLKQKQHDILANFIRAITHDFRTRLQSIQLNRHMVGRLVDKNADLTKVYSKLDLIDMNVNSISEQLNKLELLLNIDPNQSELVSCNDTIKELIPYLIQKATVKHIQLETTFGECHPFLGKANYIRTIIEQLVNNAIDNTDEGGTITIQTDHDDTHTILLVSDTGKGIEAEHLEHVFDVFYKVNEARTLGNTGMGLGLSITKTIVEAYQGTISINSVPNEYTTVTLRFPRMDID